MNKKGILLIVIVLIFIICTIFFVSKNNSINTENGSFNSIKVTIKDYTIDINSKETGHPNGSSYFNTSFTITEKNGTESDYEVDFLDIKSDSENDYIDFNYDTSKQSTVVINRKSFKSYIDNSQQNAILVYAIPGDNNNLIIKISGSDVFDSNGSELNNFATIDKSVLNSKELEGILNFSVSKSK